MALGATYNLPALARRRFNVAMLVATSLHALVFLLVQLDSLSDQEFSKPLLITLAIAAQETPDEQVRFIAQHNQLASGSEQHLLESSVETPSPIFEDRTEIAAAPSGQVQRQELLGVRLLSSINGTAYPLEQKQAQNADVEGAESEHEMLAVVEEIASLRARIDEVAQAEMEAPRSLLMNSVSAKSAIEAAYLLNWSERVESVGNRNYPRDALAQGLSGHLRVLAVIASNGEVKSVDIVRSSGIASLDRAAQNIVNLAAPYPRFPPEMSHRFDQIEIVRTWRFFIDGMQLGDLAMAAKL